jgi:hypothetical protein
MEDCTWDERDVPLVQRGVRFGWLYNFLDDLVHEANAFFERMWDEYRSADRAAMYGPWNIPTPEVPPYREDAAEGLRITRNLVSDIIVPITASIGAPLYARVAVEHRGPPDVFISHTWSSMAFVDAHGSLNMLLDRYRDSFVWIDFVGYNQHCVKPKSILKDMEDIISGIGRVAFTLTREPFFTRSWCLWEIVCSYRVGAKVDVCENILRIKRKYWASEAVLLPPRFTSVADLQATNESDREMIFEQLVSTFGSVDQADEYVRGILPKQW